MGISKCRRRQIKERGTIFGGAVVKRLEVAVIRKHQYFLAPFREGARFLDTAPGHLIMELTPAAIPVTWIVGEHGRNRGN